MFTPRYRVAPLCSGAVLLVVLSACTANPTYEERAATPAPSTSTSYTVPVGQVDEYKAGRPRPSASGGTTPAGAKINGDGSWEYKDANVSMHVHPDGTWEWSNSGGDKASLKADGTWESYIAKTKERTRVNPDGSWIRVVDHVSYDLVPSGLGMAVNTDGSWRQQAEHVTLYGTSDGKVYQQKPDMREVGPDRIPDETPALPTIYGQDGVGDKSIIPLRPRTPLKAGQKNVP